MKIMAAVIVDFDPPIAVKNIIFPNEIEGTLIHCLGHIPQK